MEVDIDMNRIKKIIVFIATIILVLSSASFLKADAKNANYMKMFDKKHTAYHYSDGTSMQNPTHNKKKNQTNWIYFQNGIGDLFEKQTSKGYFINNFSSPVLKLPVKKNLTWKVGKEQRKILSTKTKVKTKYKTFENAVKVQVGKTSKKYYEYIVPNYGIVKESQKGKTIRELQSITDRYGNETSK